MRGPTRPLLLCFGAWLAITCARAATAANDVAAASGGLAAGRDITGNTINFGLTPEQVWELTEAAARGATGPLTGTIVELSKKLGVTEDATKTLLRIVGEQDVPIERLSETLNRVASDYRRLQAQAAALNPENPTARDFVDRAKQDIAAGRFNPAHGLLVEARQVQIAAAQQARSLRERAQAAEDAQLLGAAAATATEGELALTELHYLEAANLFQQAAELVPAGRLEQAVDYRERQADALYREGDEHGNNAALSSGAETWRFVLQQRPRERVPINWAATQVNLGNSLLTLGQREPGTARLEEAVAAYQAALQELQRERVPLQWAMTQVNLGSALALLGERKPGTARLEEAMAAYQAALQELQRERVPLQWANAEMNLGNALSALGEREPGTARLEQAVAAYQAALQENTRERVPLQWAATQVDLGVALKLLGEREPGTARLEQAVAAYQAALQERTRERVPLQWAMTQTDLGDALKVIGEREPGAARLEAAVMAYDAALPVFVSAQAEYYAGICRANRDQALAVLQQRKG